MDFIPYHHFTLNFVPPNLGGKGWNVDFLLLHHKLSKQWNGIFIPFHSVSFHFILPLHSIPLYFISPNRASLGISKMLCSSYNTRIMKNEFLEKARFEFYNLNYKNTF
jgi:hypothetical protein